MKDKEIMLEQIEASLTLDGAGEGGRGEGTDARATLLTDRYTVVNRSR